MSDWQVGDLAVCVDIGRSAEGFTCETLELGRVYTVVGVGTDPFGQTGLFLDEQDSIGFAGGYLAWRFRKIRPDKHEAREDEFITLLKRGKVDA